MTKRKFTPPTKFPAEYVDGHGSKVIIIGRGEGKYPLVGQIRQDADYYDLVSFTEEGSYYITIDDMQDLHDTPKRITTWHNVYGGSITSHASPYEKRTCIYRIERDEDGGNPEIFVEEV